MTGAEYEQLDGVYGARMRIVGMKLGDEAIDLTQYLAPDWRLIPPDMRSWFYRDMLGFKVAGGSESYGDEQEHLNNVFGARLRITSIRGETGPSIEFLEYLAPGPVDVRVGDLRAPHWRATR